MRSKSLLLTLLIPLYPALASDAKFHMDQGNQHLFSGKFNDAILSYDAAIQHDPMDYLSYYKRATAYLSLGKTDSAIDDFTKILELKPGFHQALLQRAKIFVADGNYELAKESLTESQDESSRSLLTSIEEAEKHSSAASMFFESQKYDQCIEHISRVIQISPQKPQWRTMRAKCHLGQGRVEEAVNDLSRVSLLNPSDQTLPMQLAQLNFYSLYEPDRALGQVKQCLHYDPEQKQCKSLFRQIKRFQKDMNKIQEAKDQKRTATALNSLIGTRSKQGLVADIDEPHKALETEMQVKLPKRLHLLCFELACSLAAEQKDAEKAKLWCSRTLELDADNAQALVYLGEHKLNENDFEGAVRDLERAYEIDQKPRVRQLLQKAQQLLKQSKKRDYYKILNIDRNADSRQIKKAYRKQAQEWHPDKYTGDLTREQVESKMADINQAYEVLSDPEKREQFDQGFDPFDPEAGSQQQHNPFNFQGGGHPFAHFGGNGGPFGASGGFEFHF